MVDGIGNGVNLVWRVEEDLLGARDGRLRSILLLFLALFARFFIRLAEDGELIGYGGKEFLVFKALLPETLDDHGREFTRADAKRVEVLREREFLLVPGAAPCVLLALAGDAGTLKAAKVLGFRRASIVAIEVGCWEIVERMNGY